jgi:hypothetical protein
LEDYEDEGNDGQESSVGDDYEHEETLIVPQ